MVQEDAARQDGSNELREVAGGGPDEVEAELAGGP